MPVALLTGTKPYSIGRFIGNELHKLGWDVWLYSRSAQALDKERWHERCCDITNESNIDRLLAEIPELNLVMMLADTGTAPGELTELNREKIESAMQAKLLGSVLICKALINANYSPRLPVIWCAGRTNRKPKNLILYSIINTGLAAFVEELNHDYPEKLAAYYLPTGLIYPSTLGNEYMKIATLEAQKTAQGPETIVNQVLSIIDGKVELGMVGDMRNII